MLMLGWVLIICSGIWLGTLALLIKLRNSAALAEQARSSATMAVEMISLAVSAALFVVMAETDLTLLGCIVRPATNAAFMCWASATIYGMSQTMELDGDALPMSSVGIDGKTKEDGVIVAAAAALILSNPMLFDYALHRHAAIEALCPLTQFTSVGIPIAVFGLLIVVSMLYTARVMHHSSGHTIAHMTQHLLTTFIIATVFVLVVIVRMKPELAHIDDIGVSSFVVVIGSAMATLFSMTLPLLIAASTSADQLKKKPSQSSAAAPSSLALDSRLTRRANPAIRANTLAKCPLSHSMASPRAFRAKVPDINQSRAQIHPRARQPSGHNRISSRISNTRSPSRYEEEVDDDTGAEIELPPPPPPRRLRRTSSL